MKPALLLAVLAVAIAASGCSEAPAMRVGFAPYAPELLPAAAAEKRPVIVFATADWCPPCQRMRREAFSDERVKSALEPFARLKLDATDRDDPALPPLMNKLKIRKLPTVIFYDREGAEVTRFEGPQPASVVLAAADKTVGN